MSAQTNTSFCICPSPIGQLKIEAMGQGLCALHFLRDDKVSGEDAGSLSHPLLKQAMQQLEEYFAGSRTSFSLPLCPNGTPFQQSVWQALQKIPYGTTCSYEEIAAAIGNPKACRAVWMANNKNPLPIFIPCHRVIGVNGKLVGYGGGLDIKLSLLSLENPSNALLV